MGLLQIFLRVAVLEFPEVVLLQEVLLLGILPLQGILLLLRGILLLLLGILPLGFLKVGRSVSILLPHWVDLVGLVLWLFIELLRLQS